MAASTLIYAPVLDRPRNRHRAPSIQLRAAGPECKTVIRRIACERLIVGFDDIKMADWPSFGLATYSQPIAPMVEQAVIILDNQMKNRSVESIQHVTDGELIVRTSARKPGFGLTKSENKVMWSMTG